MRRASGGLRAGSREWFGLFVLALPCLLIGMDVTLCAHSPHFTFGFPHAPRFHSFAQRGE